MILRDFSWAMIQLKAGMKVCRKSWNGKGMYLALQKPDENSKMQRPYIYIKPVDGFLIPWTITQTDAFAEDWELVQ